MKPDSAVTRETVLLVEHEPVTRTGISRVLSKAGYQVVEASRPDEAWTMLEARPDIGVLLADIDAQMEPTTWSLPGRFTSDGLPSGW